MSEKAALGAKVLDQTRLRSLTTGLRSNAKGNIINTLLKLKNLGKAESTIQSTSKNLDYLDRHCNINEPNDVAKFIANLNGAGSYKANLVKAYNHYVKFQ